MHIDKILTVASDLVSDGGENKEYNRAIVEMTCLLLGLAPTDDGHTVAKLIGVKGQVH